MLSLELAVGRQEPKEGIQARLKDRAEWLKKAQSASAIIRISPPPSLPCGFCSHAAFPADDAVLR